MIARVEEKFVHVKDLGQYTLVGELSGRPVYNNVSRKQYLYYLQESEKLASEHKARLSDWRDTEHQLKTSQNTMDYVEH